MKQKHRYRVNNQIRSPKIRVIGEDGKQIGVLDLEDAFGQANNNGLDLIEIAPQAKPPVVRMMELGKFQYQEEKRMRAEKKKSKTSELKEVRFSPFIAENDFATRVSRVKEFIEDKNKVRVVVKFKGRQMDAKKSGYGVAGKVLKELGDGVVVDMEPKFLGRHLVMVISPLTKGKKVEAKKVLTDNIDGDKVENKVYS